MGDSQHARIEPNARIVLDYVLRSEEGEVLDSSDAGDLPDGEPIIYIHGYGMLVPGLEKGLVGLAVGDKKDIVVTPEEGFGERDEELVMEIDRSEVPRPDKVSVGDELVAESPDGDEAVMRVIEVKEDAVVLDGNHPLAGETLRYSVVVRDVRAATDEEIEEAAAAFEDAAADFEPKSSSDGENGVLVQLGKKPNGQKKKKKGKA